MGLLSSIVRPFRRAAAGVVNPAGQLISQGVEATSALVGRLTPDSPDSTSASGGGSAALELAKAIAAGPPTIDEARLRAEQSDAFRRKRGRRASVLTGPGGVGATPIAQKTLIGS